MRVSPRAGTGRPRRYQLLSASRALNCFGRRALFSVLQRLCAKPRVLDLTGRESIVWRRGCRIGIASLSS